MVSGILKHRFLQALLAVLLSFSYQSIAWSDSYNVGFKKCQKCHEAEVDVWKKTKHFKSYKSVHKKKEAKKILKAVGGAKSMKKHEACASCHYTKVQKSPKKKAKVKAGPSCESCHGTASAWLKGHNDYGGKSTKAKDESAAHKAKRIKDATDKGMIWSNMTYDIAANCMTCHGLAHPNLDGETLSTMLTAGHPIEADFELVQYSQGSVRHRFYPPNVNKNAKMTSAELSRFFVIGQAAKLVSATNAANKSDHPDYKKAQKERAADARKALKQVAHISAVAKFLKKPDEAGARAVQTAIAGKDLSAKLKGQLPATSKYK